MKGQQTMTGIKIMALSPLIATIDLPAGAEKYGLVGCLVAAVIALYLDSKADRKAAAKREVESTKAMTANAEANRYVAGVLVEVKDAIKGCRAKV